MNWQLHYQRTFFSQLLTRENREQEWIKNFRRQRIGKKFKLLLP